MVAVRLNNLNYIFFIYLCDNPSDKIIMDTTHYTVNNFFNINGNFDSIILYIRLIGPEYLTCNPPSIGNNNLIVYSGGLWNATLFRLQWFDCALHYSGMGLLPDT